MYKEVLRSIDNIAIWPVISFVIFFSFFIGLLWFTFKADKNFIKRMSNMPIEDDAPSQPSSETLNKKS
jgi:cytochrome c oxidase cbb3-type subunit 4